MASDGVDPGSLVSNALLRADNIGQAMITVEDLDGTITLKGNVESEQDRFTAVAIAQKQEGVLEVINKLKATDL